MLSKLPGKRAKPAPGWWGCGGGVAPHRAAGENFREICPQIAEFRSDFPENIGLDRAQDWSKIQSQARLRLAGFPGFPGSQANYSTTARQVRDTLLKNGFRVWKPHICSFSKEIVFRISLNMMVSPYKN